ncbi:MAG: cysteine--tRNA ligase, partial [Promethearchaeota archaeon]
MLRLYDTLSREIRDFEPLEDEVKFYACGPTVYSYAHIGHMRTYVNNDCLRRTLEYLGHQVKHVMNITDVGHLTSDEDFGEDKMAKGAKKEGLTIWDLAKKYTDHFYYTMDHLNVLRPHHNPKATETIEEQIDFVRRLEEKEYTYKTSVGLIYDTSKYLDYTKLARLSLEGQQVGVRVEVDPDRKNPWDFALWITNQPDHLMQWDSPWGRGFPGWHLECSVMSRMFLGDTLDIHAGGIEHIPVHHTNEIAQSEAVTGKKFVRFWFHNHWLIYKGEKMSKSLGNIITIDTMIERDIDPLVFRFMYLNHHYRSTLEYDEKILQNTIKSYNNFRAAISHLGSQASEIGVPLPSLIDEFKEVIGDDLALPRALTVAWKVLREDVGGPEDRLATIVEMDKV